MLWEPLAAILAGNFIDLLLISMLPTFFDILFVHVRAHRKQEKHFKFSYNGFEFGFNLKPSSRQCAFCAGQRSK